MPELAMTPATVEFDFDSVVRVVERADSRANRDDAEEAVQGAVVAMLGRDEPLIPSYVVMKARSVLGNAVRRSERRNSSLDAFLESDEDSAPIELAVESADVAAEAVERVDLDRHPVRGLLAAAADVGSRLTLHPRGTFSTNTRYSDETVAEARRLRTEEGLSYARIAKRLGCAHSTVENWCTRRSRTISIPGWTRDRAIAAVKHWVAEHGRLPTASDARTDPLLPCGATYEKLFGTWNGLIEAADFPTRKPGWSSLRDKRAQATRRG